VYSVLLVDDEPWAIEGLKMFVDWEGLGFRVCGECENGAEALSAARRSKPDVIVTDIRMPEMDGLELIGRLREERGAGAEAEIVVLSAYGEFAMAKRAMQLGVRHYLLKPVLGEEAAEVLTRIRLRLDGRRTVRMKTADDEEAKLPALAAHRMKALLQAIEEANRERAANEIDGLSRELQGRSREWAGLFAGSLLVQCGKLIRESGGDPAMLFDPGPGERREDEGERARESVWARVQSYTEQAINALLSIRELRGGGTMAEIDRYVREFYRNPLSIREVAARFYLNPVYLGKAYQDKFGRGLLDRMHDLRIAEACVLLRSTAEPTCSIAERVGYAHYRQFLRHFERRMGRKPADYRASETDF